MRYYAQRRHIIHSIDGLCYQLFALSFLLAPSLLQLVARTTSQFQFSRPRDLDSHRSLRFWVFIICCANTGSVLNHVTYRPSDMASRRGLVLDFIGMASIPSKTQLLTLDLLIISLQLILLCIAYETSLSRAMPPETRDPLSPSDSTPTELGNETSSFFKPDRNLPVLHLRLRPTIRRILDPPPETPSSSSDSSNLPLPNTTPFIFPSAGFPIQIAFRTRTRGQARRDVAANEGAGGGRSVPGGLDVG